MANFQAMFLRFILLTALFPSVCYAQSANTVQGARAAGMGNAFAVMPSEWNFFGNMAGLASLKIATISSTYEARALPGANQMAVMGIKPLKSGVTGIGIFRFGDDVYNEQAIQGAYAHQIGNTALGVRAGYYQYRTVGFGTRGLLSVSLGGITQISKQVSIGAWIQNVNMPKLRFSEKQVAPVKLIAAIGYKPTENFILTAEIEKDVLYEALWKGGMEYRVHKKVFVRSGFNINPGSAFFGLGFQSWRVKIDYALQTFSVLGPTHQASASYRISMQDKEAP
jgi:hypothetical protein